MIHRFPIRVYYEDTDLGQVVYYANYLRFIERGRTEWLRARGVDQSRLLAGRDLIFVVRRVEGDYLRPARFDDALEVVSTVELVQGSRIEMTQNIERAGETLFAGRVRLVCVNLATMRPARIPDDLRAVLTGG